MSNDGKKIVLTLKQVNSITFAPTGEIEPNTPGNIDYIPPYTDYDACPLSYSLACPLPVFTGNVGYIGFEFSLFNSVVGNPSVTQVRIGAISGSSANSVTYNLPNSTPNYFSGSLFISHGTYAPFIQFINSGSVLSTCNYPSSSVIVS